MKRNPSNNIIIQATSKGSSMEPLIKHGCRILVQIGDNLEYHIGDIVMLILRNTLVVHRIIRSRRKNNNYEFLLKGDNNKRADGFISQKALIGKLEKIIYPDYVIEYNNKKNLLLKKIFVVYSLLNLRYPFLFNLRKLYKIHRFKILYRELIKS